MTGLWIILAHLLGDYVFQSDWMARHKGTPHPDLPEFDVSDENWTKNLLEASRRYQEQRALWFVGHWACLLHCLVYTMTVYFLCDWATPSDLFWCFSLHFVIDRFRLAGKMMKYTGQAEFSSPGHPMFPWSVVVVDNTLHLLTLAVLAALAGVK